MKRWLEWVSDWWFALLLILLLGIAGVRSFFTYLDNHYLQPTPQEPHSEAIPEPTSGISRIEELTEKVDPDGRVYERTTRVIIYVEAEG
jgi:hypothetical protein